MADEGRISLLALLKHLMLKFPAESSSTILHRVERDIRVLKTHAPLHLFWQFGNEEKLVLWPEMETLQFKDLFRWNETATQWEVQPREPAFTDLIVQLTRGAVEVLEIVAAESSEPTPVWRPKEHS